VDLKYILRQIEPDDRNPFHGPLLDVTFLVTTTLLEAAQDEAVHNITSSATTQSFRHLTISTIASNSFCLANMTSATSQDDL
jgi:hypothetical protein